MLKRKISKAEFEDFAGAEVWKKGAYKVDPSNAENYILDAENDEGVQSALTAKQHEIDQHNATKAKLEKANSDLTEANSKVTALETEKRKGFEKNPDRDAIEADLNGKLNAEKEARTKEKEAADKRFIDHVTKSVADQMAAEISTVPGMMSREIAPRISVELTETGHVVRILDKDGKPTGSSIADLRKEFVDNADYKSVIKAGNASGGGAGNGSGGSPGAKKFSDLSESERVAFHKANPAEFERQKAESEAASRGYR